MKRRCFESLCQAWVDKNPEALEVWFSDTASYLESWGPAYLGKQEILTWFAQWTNTYTCIRWDCIQAYEKEQAAIITWEFEYATSKETEVLEGCSILQFNETGKIIRLEEYARKTPMWLPFHENTCFLTSRITIKPHHFIDIIKLYGSGITCFVLDETMGHDFYRIANRILQNPDCPIALTIAGDDICKPCKKYLGNCQDSLNHISGFTSKDVYNRTLDERILKLYQLSKNGHTARSLCHTLYQHHELIFQVWKEEATQITEKRHHLFVTGARKFLSI